MDLGYDFNLWLYEHGLRSTPPIVLPVESLQGSAELAKQVTDMETKYSNTNIITGAISDTASEVTGIVKNISLPLLLLAGIIIYFILKKELRAI